MNTAQLFARVAAIAPQPVKPTSIAGWCDEEKACALAAACLALRAKTVVEIGVFAGGSLIPMALALQAMGRGTAVAIDPWTAAAATEGYEGANKQWWGSRDHERIYQDFIRNIHAHTDLHVHVDVRRAKSDDVTPPADIDVLSVDGQHTDQAVRDVMRFAPNVRLGGMCFMDDTEWTNETTGQGVQRAVHALLGLGFVELYKIGTGACFQRVR